MGASEVEQDLADAIDNGAIPSTDMWLVIRGLVATARALENIEICLERIALQFEENSSE